MATTDLNPARRPVTVVRPQDFDEFWDRALRELDAVAAGVTLTPNELRSTDEVETFDLSCTSWGGMRLTGWYCRPRRSLLAPPYPGLLLVPGYISDPVVPSAWARRGYAALAVAPRGKVRSRYRDEPGYPGLLVRDAVDPLTYGYRAFFLDAVRSLDALRSLPEVDGDRVGVHGSSQGGALTIVVSALRAGVVRCGAAGAPYLAGFLDAAGLTNSYPYREITEYLARRPEDEPALRRTFAYYDSCSFAPAVKAPMLVYLGLQDDICPPETGFALFERLGSEKQLITTDGAAHDAGAHWADAQVRAFLARHLTPREVAA